MKRIMVLGISAGVGKSTFARRLGEKLHIPVFHLDTMYWKPGWAEASLEEFSSAQQEIVSKDQWIIEGNYSNTYEIRATNADTIIYLELPLHICLYRVIKRWILHIGRTRPDMAKGCEEKLNYAFIKFICTTYYPRKKKMIERMRKFHQINPQNHIIVLRSKQEIHDYLNQVGEKQT